MTGPYTPAEDLRDDFLGSALDTDKWTPGGATGSVTVSGGQLVLTVPSGSTDSDNPSLLDSAETYDLTGSYMGIEVVSVSGPENGFIWLLAYSTINSWAVGWDVSGGSIGNAILINGGINTLDSSINVSKPAYVRIRESAGVLYWETSSDGATWTEQYSEATPSGFDPTAVQFHITASAAPDDNEYTAVFANYNVTPG